MACSSNCDRPLVAPASRVVLVNVLLLSRIRILADESYRGAIKESNTTSKAPTAADHVSDTYNGGEMENYKWSQTLTDLDVKVPVPKGTKSKDLRVEIKSDYLKVKQLRPEKKVCLSFVQ